MFRHYFGKTALLIVLVCIVLTATSCNRTFTSFMGGGDGDEMNSFDEYVEGGDSNGGIGNSFVVGGDGIGGGYVINGGDIGQKIELEGGFYMVITGYDENGQPVVSLYDPNGTELRDGLTGIVDGELPEFPGVTDEEKEPVERYELPDGSFCNKNDVIKLDDGSIAIPYTWEGDTVFGHKVYKPDGSIWISSYIDSEFNSCEYSNAAEFSVEYYDSENKLQKEVRYEAGTMKVIDSEEHIYDVFEQYDVKFTYRSKIIYLASAEEGGYYRTEVEYLPDFDHDKPVHSKFYEPDGTMSSYTEYVYPMGDVESEELTYSANRMLLSKLTVYESGEKVHINYNDNGTVFNEIYYNKEGHMYSNKHYFYNGGWVSNSFRDDGTTFRTEEHYADGKVEVTECDEKGLNKKGTITNPDGTLYATVSYEHYEYTGRETFTKTNPQGTVIEFFERFYENGEEVSNISKEYYDNGALSRTYEYRLADGWTLEIKYDRNGNEISRFEHTGHT